MGLGFRGLFSVLFFCLLGLRGIATCVVLGGALISGRLTGELGSLLVLPVHAHGLTWKDVCERAFVAELAIAFDVPLADILATSIYEGVGKLAGLTGCTGTHLVEATGDMAEFVVWSRIEGSK